MIKKYRPYIITFYILSAISLVVASFYDLQIDISLNNPDNIFAQWLRNTGEMPSRLICPLAGAVLYYTCSKKLKKLSP
ncbi:MAG: hypothetical protein LUG95_04925 [Clostridiales bacterium]|nr:hypothetical protein [Clostridiales bacterium]